MEEVKIEIKPFKIYLKVNNKKLTASMMNNNTTRDFLSLLPLTITLEDYANTEKIYYLHKKLSIEGAPSGYNPSIGDITYYAPWGNIAIFYKDFGYANGLIYLGKIDSQVDAFKIKGSMIVTIDRKT